MVITQLVTFDLASPASAKANSTSIEAVQNAVQSLRTAKGPQHFTLGLDTLDSNKAQITAEWTGVTDHTALIETPAFKAFLASVQDSCGSPQGIYNFDLNCSVFGAGGAATAKFVEYALSDYPVSRATLEFRNRIEAEFVKFDEMFRREARGDVGVAFGWTVGEHEHESVKDEKTRRFVCVRGWNSMEAFWESCGTDSAKEAFPILQSWNAAAFKMLHVERKD